MRAQHLQNPNQSKAYASRFFSTSSFYSILFIEPAPSFSSRRRFLLSYADTSLTPDDYTVCLLLVLLNTRTVRHRLPLVRRRTHAFHVRCTRERNRPPSRNFAVRNFELPRSSLAGRTAADKHSLLPLQRKNRQTHCSVFSCSRVRCFFAVMCEC